MVSISAVRFGAPFSDDFLHYFSSPGGLLHSFGHISNVLTLIVVIDEIYVVHSSCGPCHPDTNIIEI